jgi:transketolase
MVDVFADGAQGDQQDTARAGNPVGAAIARLADADERVVALSADMSAVLTELRERHPERYFEFGIAETNVVSVAAGMAAEGLRPYVLSMAPFGAIKCAEQLRTDVAYTNLPVRFVARLSGLAMGFFGTSHHAVEDIAIARSLTNLTVVGGGGGGGPPPPRPPRSGCSPRRSTIPGPSSSVSARGRPPSTVRRRPSSPANG